MLFYTGMLTVKAIFGNNWAFQMPNYVIKNLYYDYFAALHMGRTYGRFRHEIRDAIEKLLDFGDITDFVRLVGEVLKEHSNRDKVAYGEKHLKTLMIGLLVPYESYWIRSEPESKGKYVDIFLERIPQVFIKHEIVLELKYIKKEDRLKWVDYQGNIVDPPPSAKSSVAMPAKKGRKPKVQPAPVLVPVTPTNPPVKTLLDYVSENGAVQLAGYMELPYYQRPNLLGFCLVFVGNECHKILPYQP
jgi:hypothetical protein